MKITKINFLFFIMLLHSGIFSTTAFAEDKKRSDIVSLVRVLGYGGAIHNFKNYVIRGKEKYHDKALQLFIEAKSTLNSLHGSSLNNDELIALKNIETMVDNYQASLQVAQQAYAEKKSIAEVIIETDTKVKVDDGPAVEGIDILRQNYQWNGLEQIEYFLGYGKAIHNFKNYLLRGKDKYRERSFQYFEAAEQLASKLQKSEVEAISMASADITATTQKYIKSIPRIDRTAQFITKTKNQRIMGSMVSSSDKMVRVDDSPAISGLATLGNKY